MSEPSDRSASKRFDKSGIKGEIVVVDPQAQPVQRQLFPVKEVEVDGVGMGVLSDGTPYLTLRGLARVCGVDHANLRNLTNNWGEEQLKPRGVKIKELLAAQGYTGASLSVLTTTSGMETHAFADAVCMALLEYHAFEATQGDPATAQRNFRLLARSSFRAFIYKKCGYDPDRHIPDSWRNFHERVLLNDQVPVGYFSVFRELADIVVHMIKAGCEFDSHTVPDISVGVTWGNYWVKSGFNTVYGLRLKHPHFFPDWYPQANAGTIEAWIYPAHALGTFHHWLHAQYIPEKFPPYIAGKVKDGVFLPGRAEKLIESVSRKTLPPTVAH